MTFSLTTPTGYLRGSEKEVVSVERVDPFASKASKRGKIVTIDSPKAFFLSSEVVQWG